MATKKVTQKKTSRSASVVKGQVIGRISRTGAKARSSAGVKKSPGRVSIRRSTRATGKARSPDVRKSVSTKKFVGKKSTGGSNVHKGSFSSKSSTGGSSKSKSVVKGQVTYIKG